MKDRIFVDSNVWIYLFNMQHNQNIKGTIIKNIFK